MNSYLTQLTKLATTLLKPLDNYLNNVTMYQVILRALAGTAGLALVLSFLGFLTYNPLDLLISLVVLLASCYLSNYILAKLFRAETNLESVFVTALILFLILFPAANIMEALTLAFIGVVSIASKYILAWKGRHIFNPAAFGAFVAGFMGGVAVWWVANSILFLPVLATAFLVVRKLRRFEFALIFVIASLFSGIFLNIKTVDNLAGNLIEMFVSWPIVFLGAFMLTEPITMPPTRKLRNIYATIVGLLSLAVVHVGPIFMTHELALLIGNIFSWSVGVKHLIVLKLKQKNELAKDTLEFIFELEKPLKYLPGQYLELTLQHENKDIRGNRRYFTIASSPTETDLRLGIKFNEPSSSFKQHLKNLKPGARVTGAQIAGDFLLPTDVDSELVFMAGGIGITPFRSMVKYLMDTHDKRKITLFYAANSYESLAYRDFLADAAKKLSLKVVYIIAEKENLPKNWRGETGYLTKEILKKHLKNIDSAKKVFYLSGPTVMVDIYKNLLFEQGVTGKQIKTDYFPGFA